jgi:hypothetical protein
MSFHLTHRGSVIGKSNGSDTEGLKRLSRTGAMAISEVFARKVRGVLEDGWV